MNKLKAHAQKEGLQYFVTYADNMAIEFFRKQGFSQNQCMPEPRWNGYIKDYSSSTMMQCVIHPHVNYVDISDTLKNQKDVRFYRVNFQVVLKKTTNSIQFRAQKGLKFNQEKQFYEFDEIPGLKEAGWTLEAYEISK